MRKVLLLAAVCMVGLLQVSVASARTQHLTVTNHAGLSASKIKFFEAAAKSKLNGSYRSAWHTPFIAWGKTHPWNLLLVNSQGPVNRACGPGAAGCHFVNSKRIPGAIINTNFAQTGRIWQVTGTHELDEMIADPHIQHFIPVPDAAALGVPGAQWLVEVGDPVEDFYRKVSGVPITDFVRPAWYLNENVQQDDLNKIQYFGQDIWGFSCPTGFAFYLYQGAFNEVTPNCGAMHTASKTGAPRGMHVVKRVAASRFVPIIPIKH